MRLSQLFTKTSKTAPADADSVNAQLLTRAGFISKQMAGVYNFLPLGLRVLRNIQQIVREEMDAIGSQEVLLPAMTLEESYEKTGRQGMDVLYHFLGHGETKLVLNPTHEEVITPLVQAHTFSYRDLPVSVYQIQNKFRNEARAKSGILRGREFSMKDMYSFHTSQEDFDAYYDQAKVAYARVYERMGLGEGRTLMTYASGGSFSKYSHEFQTITDIGEDDIYICEKCQIAVNKEVIEDLKFSCPQCQNTELVQKKAVEVGNIFPLASRFPDAFDFHYTDEEGNEKPIIMGCYGIGPSRLMGVLVEIFHDDRGMMWPDSVAPYSAHIVRMGDDEKALEIAEKLYTRLIAHNVEVLYDDRGVSNGEKLADADLIGIPHRLIVSKKSIEQGGIEWKRRNSTEAKIVHMDEMVAIVRKLV